MIEEIFSKSIFETVIILFFCVMALFVLVRILSYGIFRSLFDAWHQYCKKIKK